MLCNLDEFASRPHGSLRKEEMETFEYQQLTFYFNIGTAAPVDSKQEAEQYHVHRRAFNLIVAGVSKVPGWFQTIDDNGFPAQTGMQIERVSLCGFETDAEIDGKVAYSVTFHADGSPIAQELARGLKDFCLEQYRKAAGDIPVNFVKARQYNVWRRTESLDWPEPL